MSIVNDTVNDTDLKTLDEHFADYNDLLQDYASVGLAEHMRADFPPRFTQALIAALMLLRVPQMSVGALLGCGEQLNGLPYDQVLFSAAVAGLMTQMDRSQSTPEELSVLERFDRITKAVGILAHSNFPEGCDEDDAD